MKKALFAVAALSFASTSMGAVVINLTGNPTTGPQFFLSATSGTVVPDGSLIRIGTFNTPPPAGATFEEFATSTTNPFHEFARTTMGRDNGAAGNGRPVRNNIVGGTDANSPDPDSFFVGKNVYIWVYNLAGVNPSINQGLFSTNLAFLDDPAPVSTSTTGYVNAFGIHSAPLTGSPSDTDVTGGLVTRFNLAAPIPEPVTALSLAFAAVFGLVRRRR